MKKHIIILLLFITTSSFAQIDKNFFYLKTNFSIVKSFGGFGVGLGYYHNNLGVEFKYFGGRKTVDNSSGKNLWSEIVFTVNYRINVDKNTFIGLKAGLSDAYYKKYLYSRITNIGYLGTSTKPVYEYTYLLGGNIGADINIIISKNFALYFETGFSLFPQKFNSTYINFGLSFGNFIKQKNKKREPAMHKVKREPARHKKKK